MNYKLPYYMVYPIPLEYEDAKRERQDVEYMKSLYPEQVKRILPFVEEECDRMEYEGSMIYDEYPDVLSVRLMAKRICGNAEISDEVEGNIVEVLLLHELLKRRHEKRRIRRRLYPGWSEF